MFGEGQGQPFHAVVGAKHDVVFLGEQAFEQVEVLGHVVGDDNPRGLSGERVVGWRHVQGWPVRAASQAPYPF